MQQKVLITGGVSLLGLGLAKTAPKNIQLFLGYHKHKPANFPPKISPIYMEITNKKYLDGIITKLKPDIIIHTAGLSDVDYCEKNPKDAHKINVEATKTLLRLAKPFKPHFIFVSTNAVFDGTKSPYSETDKPNPINVYGKTKFDGENYVRDSGLNSTICRLITMYGWQPLGARLNPVTWKIQKLKNKEVLNMVNDRFINPLYNIEAAKAIWKMIERKSNSIFHVAGKDTKSRYRWAKLVAKVFKFDQKLIKPVASNFFDSLAPRPKDTTFKTDKMEKILGIKPLSIKRGLERMRDEKFS